MVHTLNSNLSLIDKKSIFKKCFMFVLIFFENVLLVPLIMISISRIIHTVNRNFEMYDLIILVLSVFLLIALTFQVTLFKKLYFMRLENSKVPWANSDFRDIMFSYILKLTFAFYHSLIAEFH